MRLVAMAPGGDAAFPALTDAARGWFRERRKEAFVYFRESEDPGPADVMKLRDLGPGVFWVIAAELMPEFLEHVFEATSPRVMSPEAPVASTSARSTPSCLASMRTGGVERGRSSG